MDELLTPATPPIAEAYARCERALAATSVGWKVLRRSLPETEGLDVLALSAWHRTARAAAARGQAGLNEVHDELERTLSDRPTTPIGVALRHTIQRRTLPVNLLRGPLQAMRRDGSQSAFETRDELLAHVRKLATPEGRLLLRAIDRASERNDILADALSSGVQIAAWTSRLGSELEAGQLRLPMGELRHFGASLPRPGTAATVELRRAVASQIEWARELFTLGWPLCSALGPWRGRLLAFVLRWQAAGLSALETRGADALGSLPRAGVLRTFACLSVAAATRQPPRF